MRAKILTRQNENKSIMVRQATKNIILNRYYNLYMNAYKFSGEIDYQMKEFFLKRLWADGQIAMFVIKEGSNEDFPAGLPVFVPFAPNNWNLYDWPISVNLINLKGVKFIPVGPQKVDKDCVIGYAQRNRKSVFTFVNYYAERMTDVLMTIRTNLKTAKMPWLIGGTPEEHEKLKMLFEKLENDDPELFIDSEDIDKFKSLVSGSPYIIDKLYEHYQALDNELLQFFGFNNLGVAEKKEHLISNEVEVNNAVIKANSDCFLNCMEEFFERAKEYLGVTINIELNQPKMDEFEDDRDEESEEVEEDE